MDASAAFEILGNPESIGPFVFSCEHASNTLPPGFAATESDQDLLVDHWGWDIGAANVVSALVERLGGHAVLGRYSRLIIDLNRAPESDELIVSECDGTPVSFNQDVDDAQRRERRLRYWAPYHQVLNRTLAARKDASTTPVTLLSMHSFTPIFKGRRRTVEIGVLFDDFDDLAIALADDIRAQGFDSALNEPYSGKQPQGLVYSVATHGRAQRVPYVELEIRYDLIDTPAKATAVAERLLEPLRRVAEI